MVKGTFTKDVQLTPGEEGLRNSDVQLLFECDSIVLSGRRGEGVNGPLHVHQARKTMEKERRNAAHCLKKV